MSFLLLLVPTALAIATGTVGGAAAGAGVVAVAAGTSSLLGIATIGGMVAGTVIGMKIKHGHTVDTLCYETHFTDRALLLAAVRKSRYTVTDDGEYLSVWFGERLSLFIHNDQQVFDAFLDRSIPVEEITAFFETIYVSYTAILQEHLYQQVLERAENNGLVLEQEIFHDDNSIELVMLVKE